jgi:hypothetical protein
MGVLEGVLFEAADQDTPFGGVNQPASHSGENQHPPSEEDRASEKEQGPYDAIKSC